MRCVAFGGKIAKGDFAVALMGLLALFGLRQFGRRIFD
jgi:hypothetical protein